MCAGWRDSRFGGITGPFYQTTGTQGTATSGDHDWRDIKFDASRVSTSYTDSGRVLTHSLYLDYVIKI